MKQTTDFDIVIVGAGLAGATLAAALTPSKLNIGILDRQPMPETVSGDYDLRVSSINRGSENILKQVGAWPLINQDRAHKYLKVQVCQSQDQASLSFDSKDIGEAYMGHMIENANLVCALKQRLLQCDNVVINDNCQIENISTSTDSVLITTDQQRIKAKLIVGADGPLSYVRRSTGFDETQGFYGHKCIVGTVQFTGDHQQTAWQRFLPTGPLGILPLAPGLCSLAWSCDDGFAAKRLGEDDDDFINALETALGGHLGEITAMPKRAAYPLTHMHANRYIGQRVVLIGDAAHVIHPLAGLGANLGITDAGALAQVLLQQENKKHFDPGEYETLKRYERWRRPYNQMFLSTMSSLNTLFNPKMDSIAPLRSLGLSLADKLTPAKNLLMQRAMGLDKDQPALSGLTRAN